MKIGSYFQQGDVILRRVATKSVVGKQIECGGVLQHGETTGHAHRFPPTAVTMFEQASDGRRFVRLADESMLTHEEHNALAIPGGDYELIIVREYDHFSEEARQVVD